MDKASCTKLNDIKSPLGFVKPEKTYNEQDYVALDGHCKEAQTYFIKEIEDAEVQTAEPYPDLQDLQNKLKEKEEQLKQ